MLTKLAPSPESGTLTVKITLSSAFLDVAAKLGRSPEYVAELACELFSDNPPAAILEASQVPPGSRFAFSLNGSRPLSSARRGARSLAETEQPDPVHASVSQDQY